MKKNLILEKKYHNSVAQFYSNRRLHDYIWEIPEEIFLIDRSIFTSNKKVIDMGCGPAISISKILGNKVLARLSYTGVDISNKLIEVAKTQVPKGKFICADMSDVKLPKNSFDILISLGALHHCEDKDRTLRNWINIIKPGGYLLLREPIYEYLRKGTGESPIEEGIKIKDFHNIINNHGLKVVKLTYFSTNAFHLFNKIMIKLGLKSWQNIRTLWYPVAYCDALLARNSELGHFFQPQSFAVILQKQ